MEDEDEDNEEPQDFVETLKDLMRSWRWPEWQIDQDLPKFLEVCEGVGMSLPGYRELSSLDSSAPPDVGGGKGDYCDE